MTSPSPSTSSVRKTGGFFLHVLPAILYVLAVFYAGSVGTPPMPQTEQVPADKLMHFMGFLVMQLVLFRAIHYLFDEIGFVRQLLVSTVLAAALGAGLEFFQAAFPNRDPDVFDFIADTLGAGVGAGITWWLRGWWTRSERVS